MALFSIDFGATQTSKAVENCRNFVRNQTVPLAKHAGFTRPFTMVLLKLGQKSVGILKQAWRHHESRATVRSMMALDDAILRDMNISRADLHYVLQSSSDIDPTTRLRLLSLERRTCAHADYRRRADYLSALVPAPYNGGVQNKPTQKDKTIA